MAKTTLKNTMGVTFPQPASPTMGHLASLADLVGMPRKALTLGAINWAQTSPYSLDDILEAIKNAHLNGWRIDFPWNEVGFLLAVDPGSVCMGWAVYRLPGGSSALGKTLSIPLPGEVVDAGVWRLDGGTPDIYTRIARFADTVHLFPYSKGIRALAIEDQFVGGNPQTSLIIGRARGWVEFWATQHLDIIDFFPMTPQEAKKGLTGKGNASKEEVIAQAEKLFPLGHIPMSRRDNAADAIAIGRAAYATYLERYLIALQS